MIARAQDTNGNGAAAKPGPIRCAIYTRKSVDKGNGGEFGSIEAQRESVESYIKSQRGLGWEALPQHYDDLGQSGKDTDRPAFQQLLSDVQEGQVDLVAVYRLDRLSRSQRDFLNVLDLFERHGVRFVSTTEHFDTTTPMGRFALGILIQVAQLEREVTAARVTDKIAASRKRGIWTGGAVPLGYHSVDKRLVIDAAGADAVRGIVEVYLETGSLTGTLEVLRERGIVNKSGTGFSKASLRSLLHNPLLAGKIRAGDVTVPAEHEAILDEAMWVALQGRLARPEPPSAHRRQRAKSDALLAGLLECAVCGASLTFHSTGKGNKRYGSYACGSQLRKGAASCPGSRAPAGKLEAAVVGQIIAIGRDPALVAEAVVAAQAELAARGPELADAIRKLNQERRRLTDERSNIADAVAADGASPALRQKLAETEAGLEQVEGHLRERKVERAALKDVVIDEADLRGALASFTPIWAALFPKERARILNLLIQVARVNVPTGEVEVVLRPEGVRLLARPETKELP